MWTGSHPKPHSFKSLLPHQVGHQDVDGQGHHVDDHGAGDDHGTGTGSHHGHGGDSK